MQELIKIEKRVIGAEETNSVNAREIHTYLGVKTVFADWIKRAIKKYDFLENLDYTIVLLKNEKRGKTGIPSTKKEYIVTIDMGKELAMLENNAKGKETRKYFIAVEKEYQTQQLPHVEMFTQFIQSQSQQNEMLMQQMTMLTKLVKTMQEKQETQKSIVYEHKTLTTRQMDKIKATIAKAAIPVAKFHKLTVPTATRVLYGELNGRMGVSTYYQILSVDFFKAMLFLRNTEEKAKLEMENINEILSNAAGAIYDEYYDEEAQEE